jgi:hypothetical protein
MLNGIQQQISLSMGKIGTAQNRQFFQEFAKLSRHRMGTPEYTDTLGCRVDHCHRANA